MQIKIMKIKDVSSFQRGITYSKKDEVEFSKIAILRANNINKQSLNLKEIKYINDNIIIPASKKVKKNCILMCISSGSKQHLGKVAFIEKDMDYYYGGFMGQLIPSTNIFPKYLYYIFIAPSYRKYINNKSDSLNINNLKFSDIENFEIKVPSITEQKRIVKILDKALEDIDKAKDNIQKNIKNTKNIFINILSATFINKNKDWKEEKISDIAELSYGLTEKSKDEGKYRYIRITDISSEGELNQNNKVFVSDEKDIKQYVLKENDLLMARTGATFGKVMIYKDYEPSVFASYLIKIDFNKNIENKLFWYFSKSKIYWDQANHLVSGAAQPHFNGNALNKLVFTFPDDIQKQQEIVKELDKLSDQTKKLEAIYQKKLDNLEELKKSLLNKAFNGEL